MKNIYTAPLLIGFFISSLFLPSVGNALFGPWAGKHQPVKAENGYVRIPLNKINDGKAHHFSYRAEGLTIKFFVVKSSDGILRAAFDACDVCFPKRKGYSQSGDFMICNNCGQRFHSTKINVQKGGCNPAPLRRIEKNGELIIAAADILTGYRYF